jgi:hypothetical protein
VSSIFDDMLGSVMQNPAALGALAQQLGTDDQTAEKAAQAALPALFGALARNSQQGAGADELLGALQRDHDGSVLDDLPGLLGQGGASQGGDAILGHMLGGRRGAIEGELSKETGLDGGSIAQLLVTLAPMVMGALGRAQRDRGFDSGGLAAELGREQKQVESSMGDAFGGLGRILDMDGDGRIDPHVKSIGAKLLGKLFGGR